MHGKIVVREQLSLPIDVGLASMERTLADGTASERGAVFTKREIAEFILDLIGYRAGANLYQFKLLEPSFGRGDFLIPAAERLFQSVRSAEVLGQDVKAQCIWQAIRGVEIHKDSFEQSRAILIAQALSFGYSYQEAAGFVDHWLMLDDFLLTDLDDDHTHVVGNPPYLRQERIPSDLLAQYRLRFGTLYDRADLYVPFFERGLNHLSPDGKLGFICPDRWIKNKYGGPLRAMITARYWVQAIVAMHTAQAFEDDVTAYPAIFIIRKVQPGATRVATLDDTSPASIAQLFAMLTHSKPAKDLVVTEVSSLGPGLEPWLIESDGRSDLIRRLESTLPTLEEAGCKVGIGVASGADKVFIGNYDDLPVEPDRKLPLITTKNIRDDQIVWSNTWIVNPFDEAGHLVDLVDYPLLMSYFRLHEQRLRARNCAKRTQSGWYRTIDKISAGLTKIPKLLIPDIKSSMTVAYDPGKLYPHHNLYFVVSKDWDLMALRTVLKSRVAHLFLSSYSLKMRGGYFRFQAQYLRKLRIPYWSDVSHSLRQELIDAGASLDAVRCDHVCARLYGLSQIEQQNANYFSV